jgi:hypothetical protein
MPDHNLTLLLLPDTFAICRLEPAEPIPAWAVSEHFFSVTRSDEELSVVCREEAVPAGVRCVKGWRCLCVAGTLDLALVGVLASLSAPLADAGVGLFAVSTFDTDYLLIRNTDVARALAAFQEAGHTAQ